MKLFKKIRKGFTLIELVVVIAVIAILSAVSVVSYVAITNRAKQSSDEQAVRQMNTALKANSVLGFNDITELFNALAEEGMNAENFKPLSKNTYFFWDQENNEIVYAKYKDGAYVGIYPDSYKDKTAKQLGNHHWLSLSKEIQTVEVSSIPHTGTAYTISSGEQLYSVIKDETVKPSSITLTQDIDLMGADISFDGITSFDGAGKTVSNVNQLQNKGFDNNQKEKMYSGLYGEIKSGDYLIKDVTFDNLVVGSASNKFCGIIAGAVRNGTVTVRDVTINDCSVYALQKGGILVGYLNGGTLTVEESVSITGCKVGTLYGEGGKLVGAMGGATFINKLASWDVALESLPTDFKMDVAADSVANKTATDGSEFDSIKVGTAYKNMVGSQLVYSKADPKSDEIGGEAFRYFNKDAIFTVTAGSTATYGVSTSSTATYKASSVKRSVNVSGYTNPLTIGALPVTPAML